MKDMLIETLKLEQKIRRGHLLRNYYSGNITWLQFCEENDKLNGMVKALTEESAIKPQFRAELEKQTYPLEYWLEKVSH